MKNLKDMDSAVKKLNVDNVLQKKIKKTVGFARQQTNQQSDIEEQKQNFIQIHDNESSMNKSKNSSKKVNNS